MTWFITVMERFFNKVNRGRAKKDKATFPSITSNGYVSGSINNKMMLEHRVVWEMFNGEIPEWKEIDHINHMRTDNRIENLRLVSRRENTMNITKQLNNTSGITGVYWHKGGKKWMAQIKIDRQPKYLGLFDDLEFAELVVSEAYQKYGFHLNHGK